MKPTNGHTPYRHIRRRLVTRNKKSQGKWFKEGKKKEGYLKCAFSYAEKRNFYSYSSTYLI